MKLFAKTNVFPLLLLVIAAVLIGGCAQYGAQPVQVQPTGQQEAGQEAQQQAQAQVQPPSAPPVPPEAPTAAPPSEPVPAQAAESTVEIAASGFSPASVTIKAGETVKFVNKDAAQHWPASAVHPTHAVYPEPGGCIGSKFDACKGLAQDETFSFVFNEKGSWKYHDHLNPALWGTVVVE